jgi:hypothetical protein
MHDTSVTKVSSAASPKGKMGQKYLASGVTLAMRLWDTEAPGEAKPSTRRDYETVGYVVKGRAKQYEQYGNYVPPCCRAATTRSFRSTSRTRCGLCTCRPMPNPSGL